MGGLSAVHQFTKIGAYCFIANNAAVTRDVPPYVMAVGQPAEAAQRESEGLKRRGFYATSRSATSAAPTAFFTAPG